MIRNVYILYLKMFKKYFLKIQLKQLLMNHLKLLVNNKYHIQNAHCNCIPQSEIHWKI